LESSVFREPGIGTGSVDVDVAAVAIVHGRVVMLVETVESTWLVKLSRK
jgi:hypothetical protein